jgi:hypothetical protein
MKYMKFLRQIELKCLNHKPAVLVFVILAVLGFSFLVTADESVTVCPFKLVTGMPCPGCGLGHSFICISHGNLSEAVQHHLLGPVVYLYLILIFIISIVRLISRKQIVFVTGKIRYKLFYTFAFILCSYHLIRLAGILFENQVVSYLKSSFVYILYCEIFI